jgi:hypothetical protein
MSSIAKTFQTLSKSSTYLLERMAQHEGASCLSNLQKAIVLF